MRPLKDNMEAKHFTMNPEDRSVYLPAARSQARFITAPS